MLSNDKDGETDKLIPHREIIESSTYMILIYAFFMLILLFFLDYNIFSVFSSIYQQ